MSSKMKTSKQTNGIAAMAAILAFSSAMTWAGETGYRPIFDGKTLTGWDGDPGHWRVEDGTITGQTTADNPLKGNTFIVWRAGETDDFELKLQYRIVGGNSGIQYRSFEKPDEWGKWVIGGYQADIDSKDRYSGILYGERYRGILGDRGQKTVIGDDHKPNLVGQVGDSVELQKSINKEDWNDYHIIARGHHFTHMINGKLMVDVVDEDKSMRRRGGLLALQLHAGPPMLVQFRNIQLKRLPLEDAKKVVFLAGKKSHGYGAHEHYAGCRLLADALNENVPNIHAVVYRNGWPSDSTAFDNADAVVMYSDGGEGHPVMPHMAEMDKLTKKGIGLACLHYAVEIPKGRPGDALKSWIGGYFETWWSVNPHWTADFKTLPDHPITRGVKPFTINDEWYYHMRFQENGVSPILTAIPPASTLERKDGPHSGNKHVRARKGMAEHVAWAVQRPDGGRGFGFTGGHFHWNWGHDDFRKLVLNAIVWTAQGNIPAGGVYSKSLTVEELEANQDEPKPKNFKPEVISKQLQEWNGAAASAKK